MTERILSLLLLALLLAMFFSSCAGNADGGAGSVEGKLPSDHSPVIVDS